jgi:hypothetical protein
VCARGAVRRQREQLARAAAVAAYACAVGGAPLVPCLRVTRGALGARTGSPCSRDPGALFTAGALFRAGDAPAPCPRGAGGAAKYDNALAQGALKGAVEGQRGQPRHRDRRTAVRSGRAYCTPLPKGWYRLAPSGSKRQAAVGNDARVEIGKGRAGALLLERPRDGKMG